MTTVFDNAADRYENHMRYAHQLYEDVIGLTDFILPGAFITQLGGMCLAIQAPVEGGWIWVTAKDDNLPWNRKRHAGWSVGLYLGDPNIDCGDVAHRSGSTDDSSLGGLVALITKVVYG